jgi:hypothetical protein
VTFSHNLTTAEAYDIVTSFDYLDRPIRQTVRTSATADSSGFPAGAVVCFMACDHVGDLVPYDILNMAGYVAGLLFGKRDVGFICPV